MSELKQKVLKHVLAEAGFPDAEYRGVPGRMFIDRKNDRMPDINDVGDIHYGTEYDHMAIHTIRPLVDRVNEMVAAWNNARPMPFEDVSQFRKLTEHNNIVLAARDDTGYGRGLYFATWRYDTSRTGVELGNYTADYDAAKQDFAVRAGLIPRTALFTREQAAEIKNAVMYRIENDGDMTISDEEQLRSIAARLTDGYSLTDPTDIPSQPNMQVTQGLNGDLNIGDWVIAAPSDEYGYLIGTVTAIDKLGTPEHETENETDDVHVDFTAFDYPQERIAEIEEDFSDLYGEPKTFDELPLDDVIMAPKMLIRITHLGHDEITRMGNIRENCEAFCNCFPGAVVPQNEKHAALLERLDVNLTDYHNSLMSFGRQELIDMAGKIVAMSDAHEYMACVRDFSDEELDFYLQFQNPLEVVTEERLSRTTDYDDIGNTMDYIKDNTDEILPLYPSIFNVATPAQAAEVCQPSDKVSQVKADKPKSLAEKLRAAGEKVKAQDTSDKKDKSHKREERE